MGDPPQEQPARSIAASPLRRSLRRRGFRRFWIARTISQWGDTFNAVALVVLVYQLTGSGLRVAGTVAVEIVPILAFGFIAGGVVDRLPRRAVMVVADLGRAVIAAALTLFHHDLAIIYVAAFGLSSFTVFFNPAAASVIPAIAGEDNLVGANSAIWSAAVISQIALAPAAGALVAAASASPAFAINAVSFVISATLLARLPLPRQPASTSDRRLRHLAAGIHVIARSRFLRTLAVVQALAALSAGATSALLVVLAQRHLHAGAGRYGLLLGAIGIGAGLGPLVIQRLVEDVGHRGWLFGPYLLRAATDLTLASTSNFAAALAALGVYGIGTSTGNITYNTVLQTTIEDQVRGRVFVFYDIVWQACRFASIAIGGVIADRIGITAIYYLGGTLLIAAATLGILAAGSATANNCAG